MITVIVRIMIIFVVIFSVSVMIKVSDHVIVMFKVKLVLV